MDDQLAGDDADRRPGEVPGGDAQAVGARQGAARDALAERRQLDRPGHAPAHLPRRLERHDERQRRQAHQGQRQRDWDGAQDQHRIAIEKKRKLFLAGLRPQQYRIFVDGQLVQTYEGS